MNGERQFGPYRLVQQIAVGGMAEISSGQDQGHRRLREVRGAQDDPPQLLHRSAVHRDADRRGQDHRPAAARQHRSDLRPRSRRQHVLHHHGVRRRRRSVQAPAQAARKRAIEMPFDVAAFIAKDIANGLDYAHRKRDHSDGNDRWASCTATCRRKTSSSRTRARSSWSTSASPRRPCARADRRSG